MPSEHARHWTLDPDVDFLNHGSYGAAPRVVLDAQAEWRARIEREPVRFMAESLEPAMDHVRAVLGAFVGADANDVVLLPNATTGVNTVLRSLRLQPGDELLTTDHAYNAVRNALEVVAAASGARVVVAAVPFPHVTPALVRSAVLSAVSPRTRLAVLDHVTSPTALVLPIAELVRELSERGVDTLVDGAHAPGMLELNLDALGAAYYAGNLHKWVCAPKGAGFLWVRRDRQAAVRPLVISHGGNSPRSDRSRFQVEFGWMGTADPTPWLAVPAALEFGSSLLPGGWQALRHRNRDLALAARDAVARSVGAASVPPDEMIGSMARVPLEAAAGFGRAEDGELYDDPASVDLRARGFQVMLAPWPQRPAGQRWRRLLRVSAAPYNDLAQFERLAAALPEALGDQLRS